MLSSSKSIPWPHKPKDYEWKGTIRESKSTTKILAHCVPKNQDVLVEIKNMEMIWDMNEIAKYLKQIHDIMKIQHSNVLSPCHTFQHKSEIWIIYPLQSGGSLYELFTTQYRDGIPDEMVVATILYDVACGLSAIHSSRLVHRNIRSSSLHMSKSTGRTLLKHFFSLETFKWKTQFASNDESYSLTEVALPNTSSNTSCYSGDIYSFGVLAMELCFGYPPPRSSSMDDSENDMQQISPKSLPTSTERRSLSFDDYQKQCPFSDAFQELVKQCLDTNNRISLKDVLCHGYFMNRKCQYDKVMQYIEPIRSTESKILPSSNYPIHTPVPKLNKNLHAMTFISLDDIERPQIKAKDSIELTETKQNIVHNDKDTSWDFGLDFDDMSVQYSREPLILNEVQYDDDDQHPHMESIKLIGSDDGTANTLLSPRFKPALLHSHTYSNTIQSTISRLSPVANATPHMKYKYHQQQTSFKLPHIIRLNIGGKIFCTSVTTLRKYDTMLSKKFSGDYDAEYDMSTDSYFIDRDGSHFKHILNYLRTGRLIIPRPYSGHDCFDALLYQELYEEACYYQVSDLINVLNPDNIYFYSKILPNQHYVQILKKWIANPTANTGINIEQSHSHNNEMKQENEDMDNSNDKVVLNQKWRLIYRASDDGYNASDFHRQCDLQGPTVTLIHANNRIFGGYTNISWKADGKDKYAASKQECVDTFIFVMNITNKVNKLKAFKWNFIEKYYSSYGSNLPVAHEKNIGACFGWYHVLNKRRNTDQENDPTISQDGIIIGDNCNVQNNSSWTYCAFFNTPKQSADLAGSKYFFVKDIEVYQISFQNDDL